MSGMKKTRPEAPNSACLRPDVCQDLTSACARSACHGEKNATAVGLPQPALNGKCAFGCSRVVDGRKQLPTRSNCTGIRTNCTLPGRVVTKHHFIETLSRERDA